jgi:hypothetical protein
MIKIGMALLAGKNSIMDQEDCFDLHRPQVSQ